jgi:hypothetical protein
MQRKMHVENPDSTSFHQNHFEEVTITHVALWEQSDIPGITLH